MSPASCIALICSFCCAVNDTPARVSAVTPFVGSFSALPTCNPILIEVTRGAERLPIGFNISRLIDASGTAAGWIVVFQDLSQWRRLQEELGRRDASLTQQRQAHTNLEERLLRVEREAHQSAQNLANALHVKQQESESYLQGARSAEDAHQRERRSVRLWQVVALIAILNTLVLLALYLNR